MSESLGKRILRYLTFRNEYVRLGLAEFIGTFLLMVFGMGASAQSVLSKGVYGNIMNVTVGWGLAVFIGVAASFGVSGGHINPAVTLAMAVFGRLKWRKVPVYLLGQYLGAFIASAVIFCVYCEALNTYDPDRTVTGPNATAGIFIPFPQPYISICSTVLDQLIGTALLLIGVFTLVDPKSPCAPSKAQLPIMVGVLIILLGSTFCYNCGMPINPARDMGPRLFIAIAGWGGEAFSNHHYWFWVPSLIPVVGGILGAGIYQILVGLHWPVEKEETHDAENMLDRFQHELAKL